MIVDITQPLDKSTLLHFTAQLGLFRVASFFLDKPGGDIALKTPNRHGYLPREIAAEHGYTELTELLTELVVVYIFEAPLLWLFLLFNKLVLLFM